MGPNMDHMCLYVHTYIEIIICISGCIIDTMVGVLCIFVGLYSFIVRSDGRLLVVVCALPWMCKHALQHSVDKSVENQTVCEQIQYFVEDSIDEIPFRSVPCTSLSSLLTCTGSLIGPTAPTVSGFDQCLPRPPRLNHPLKGAICNNRHQWAIICNNMEYHTVIKFDLFSYSAGFYGIPHK